MKDEEKKMICPDIKEVSEIMRDITKYLKEKKPRILDTISAMISIIVTIAQDHDLKKYSILNYLSNSWELNGPDNNDHPERMEENKVEF